ncbi:hypothetical protein L873DRAFT_620356 [Choiromyces venosus 120613-1]|uniref:Uncharacterized protein n=1 Tax=Choiromyces venosus 120613-1 TaxID=1336337 RepID=A0A3N4ITX2_9PEZI|nr:hypothetical protein L873DRAFT_620356 [Choiromyces venosus 120613-1]
MTPPPPPFPEYNKQSTHHYLSSTRMIQIYLTYYTNDSLTPSHAINQSINQSIPPATKLPFPTKYTLTLSTLASKWGGLGYKRTTSLKSPAFYLTSGQHGLTSYWFFIPVTCNTVAPRYNECQEFRIFRSL